MITFYDLASSIVDRSFTPNPGKTRIELNFRGIQYKTEYIEYPDVEEHCKKIGALPTSKKPDGTDFYTLPVIHDSTTGKTISDSYLISQYLEQTYPDTPRLFPTPTISSQQTLSTTAAIQLFEQFFMENVAMPLMPIIFPMFIPVMSPYGAAYFRRTRELKFGGELEDLSPAGSPKRAEDWKKVREGLDKVATILDQNSSGGEYFLGDVFSRADVILIACLSWIPVFVGKEEWESIATANGGRWGILVEKTKALQAVKD